MKKDIPERFKPQTFEEKWQMYWEETGIFSPDMRSAQRPYYNLMMFPYPSAEGLHVGNMYAFTGVDVHGRFMRHKGYTVFEPIGLDGFGIHSENYALKMNRHPKKQAVVTEHNFYRQLRATGNAFDWQRTLETYDPDYYRWTQWIFVQMFKHGLAYRAKAEVNWCPSCKTVLADEQVLQGSKMEVTVEVCERCGTEVERKELEQWFFRITAYAEKLLQNTYKPSFKWTNKVKLGQRNWIGKKEGITIKYQVSSIKYQVEVFTTAPVNFGMTFLVLSPDHDLVNKILDKSIQIGRDRYTEVEDYVKQSLNKTVEERKAEGREKTGVLTGLYVINPVNNKKVPVWISDFVVKEVGTGAVQGCPGHDYKDFEFAQKFGIPIPRVVVGTNGDTSQIDSKEKVIAHGMNGTMINSGFLNGMEFEVALQKTMDYFEEKGWGKRVVTYHLRDWLISRQRYWGAPIPMIYCETCAKQGKSWFTTNEATKIASGIRNQESWKNNHNSIFKSHNSMKGWYPVSEDQLPVKLPDVEDWRPTGTGRGPLAGHPEFYQTKCPHCCGIAVRETDVCDTFLDSSWYYIRYPSLEREVGFRADENFLGPQFTQDKARQQSPKDSTFAQMRPAKISPSQSTDHLPWDNEINKNWFPVDSYIGGAEHTVLHLLYTRFVYMVLKDWGFLAVKEPQAGEDFNPDEPFKRFYAHGLIIKDGAKMSKSKGNVVIPDDYIKLYGSDTLRTYLMFLGPFDHGGDFRDTGIAGMYRWLSRVWRLANETAKNPGEKTKLAHKESLKMIHVTIKEVSEDLEKLHYNTAIAKLMEYVNWWMDHPHEVTTTELKSFLVMLSPFAPHMTEELCHRLGQKTSVHLASWPEFDPSLTVAEQVTVVVQVNGKLRDTLKLAISKAKNQKDVEQIARSSAKISKWISNKSLRQTVFVPAKLINFVTD